MPENKPLMSSTVRIDHHENGVYSIQIHSPKDKNLLSSYVVRDLLRAFDELRRTDFVKVLILKGAPDSFLHGANEQYNIAVEKELYQAIASFPYPVIALMQGDAKGAGFFVGAICDFMVLNQDANYAYTNAENGFFPGVSEEAIFTERFGKAIARDLCYRMPAFSPGYRGAELKEKGWTCPILSAEEAESFALGLAQNLAKKTKTSLKLLKQHLAKEILRETNSLSVRNSVAEQPAVKAGKISKKYKTISTEVQDNTTLLIRISSAPKKSETEVFIRELIDALSEAAKEDVLRCVVLASDRSGFLPRADSKTFASFLDKWQKTVAAISIPVISVLDTDTNGAAWLAAELCDVCIYNSQSKYTITDLCNSDFESVLERAVSIFSYRFGSPSEEIFLSGKEYTALDLSRRFGVFHSEKKNLISSALQMAKFWAKWPASLVKQWKEESSQELSKRFHKTHFTVSTAKKSAKKSGSSKTIPLTSEAVSAQAQGEIFLVRMQDRNAKNMFSDALIEGLNEAFYYIQNSGDFKVVVLTGYDSYFASGGTRENLLSIQEGKSKFTDNKIFELPLQCKIPVISAMQGHAIGGGWSLGMFADFVLFSEESKYFSPYMEYGFTPGAGATFIFPQKIGLDLARETLFTAQEFSGKELKLRGLSFPVAPREKTEAQAIELAKKISVLDRDLLIKIKQSYSKPLLERLETTYSLELDMHDKTFVAQSDARNRIDQNFQTGENSNQNVADHSINRSASANLPEVKSVIKELLAQELHMQPGDINEDTQFINLGLDSIVSVTWVRKINERYQTSLEATKVYRYPTLNQLSAYVCEIAKTDSVAAALVETPSAPAPLELTNSQIELTPSDGDVKEVLKTLLAHELHMQESDIDEDKQFINLGLDSIVSVTWVRKINERYHTSIDATKVYRYPTLKQLSQFVSEEAKRTGYTKPVSKTPAPVSISEISQVETPHRVSLPEKRKLTSWRKTRVSRGGGLSSFAPQPIAIVGMAGQFPQAKNTQEFWENISQGKNCVQEIPSERWDIHTYYREGNATPGKTNCKWMGVLDEYDRFDPLFFHISPTEAESMDPQQRIFLQACWHVIEDAGYNPRDLSGSKCGVFVGCGPGDYHLLSRDLQISAQGFTGGDTSILAARISYLLNLQGPCLSIETACSSSLVAIAGACDSLLAGNSDLAIAGGVYVMAGPEMHIKTSQTGMLSPSGRCFTFDQRANGFVPGEGVGAILLKRLEDAERDNDTILGLIQGWGVNQDGKTNGITAPNPESQTRLQQDVYKRFQIDPAKIQLVEAHGTGTKLGDPIEVEALKESFGKYTQEKNFCALGSVKSNIGHCLTAAGITGTIKLLLALQNRQLPPTINYDELNEHIVLKDSPFYINHSLQEWNPAGGENRQAAISSFGFSGTNAHLVISEYRDLQAQSGVFAITENDQFMIPLSAKAADRLRQKAADLLEFIQRKKSSLNLTQLAFTLQVGREAMEERLCFMACSVDELSQKLQAFLNEDRSGNNYYRGNTGLIEEGFSLLEKDKEMKGTIVETWISQKKLSKLADLWVQGLDFDWNKLYGEKKPRRIRLPLYPFAKERYWVNGKNVNVSHAVQNAASSIHPLVQTNTSNFYSQSYETVFNGEEYFLRDHQIKAGSSSARKVLPGVAYLEMARAAISHALPFDSDLYIELHNIAWLQPIFVDSEKTVQIALYASGTQELLEEEVSFEIFSGDEGEKIHCQGEASFRVKPETQKLDFKQLQAETQDDVLSKDRIYELFEQAGLSYGPAHQVIQNLFLGNGRAFAKIQMSPKERDFRAGYQNNFILPPGVMDGALQATIGLIADLKNISNKPSVPFALESLRILAPCTDEMFAWLRFSKDQDADKKTSKIDMDLCDANGNICVQVRGFSARTLSGKTLIVDSKTESHNFDEQYYENILENILNKKVSINEAVELS